MRRRAGASERRGRLGEVVILHMGNNGAVSGGQFDGVLHEPAGARQVIVVNVKVPRPWEGPNSSVLPAGSGRQAKAVLVDWRGAEGGGTTLRTTGPTSRRWARRRTRT